MKITRKRFAPQKLLSFTKYFLKKLPEPVLWNNNPLFYLTICTNVYLGPLYACVTDEASMLTQAILVTKPMSMAGYIGILLGIQY